MNKKIVCVVFLLVFPLCFSIVKVSAENRQTEEFFQTLREEIDALDSTAFRDLLDTMTEEQRSYFENTDWKEFIYKASCGEYSISFDNFGEFIAAQFSKSISKYILLAASVIAISVLTSLLSSTRSGFIEEGVGNVIFYAGYCLVLVLILVSVNSVLEIATETISSVQSQMTVIMPIMLTFLAASGAEVSVGVYQPMSAFLSTGVVSVFKSVLIPILYAMILLAVVGHLSDRLKTSHLFSLFASVCKWLIVTSLAVYSFFLALQGVTAAGHDGISYRLLKYTIGNSLPIVGGSIRDGIDLMLASGIMVKNAVGYFALFLLFIGIISCIAKLLAFSWMLKATAGILQPLGEDRVCGFVAQLGTVLQYCIAIVASAAFLYALTLFALITASSSLL